MDAAATSSRVYLPSPLMVLRRTRPTARQLLGETCRRRRGFSEERAGKPSSLRSSVLTRFYLGGSHVSVPNDPLRMTSSSDLIRRLFRERPSLASPTAPPVPSLSHTSLSRPSLCSADSFASWQPSLLPWIHPEELQIRGDGWRPRESLQRKTVRTRLTGAHQVFVRRSDSARGQ